MIRWVLNLFKRKPLAERQQEAKETAIDRAIRKCRRYWKLKEWKPFELLWVEGDGLEGGVPYKWDERWANPYGGLYYIGESRIVMVMYSGKFSVRVLVHEICHFILDQLLANFEPITWHHTALRWLVFGWRPEAYAEERERKREKQEEGAVKRNIRRIARCPRIENCRTWHISATESSTVIADVLPAKKRKNRKQE